MKRLILVVLAIVAAVALIVLIMFAPIRNSDHPWRGGSAGSASTT